MAETVSYRKSGIFSGCYRLLPLLIFLSLLHGCQNKTEEVRILFTGDILLSRNVGVEIDKKGISPWIYIDSEFKKADFVIGNLEGAVGERDVQDTANNESPVFIIPRSSIPLLSDAGFDALSLENNHSNDILKGKENTAKELVSAKIKPLTYNYSPHFITIKNTTIALIAINLVPGSNEIQKVPSIEIKQKLTLAKTLSSLVVVIIHWGSELLDWPNKQQREAALWLTKNGADLIIGSHPHVIQQPELINGKPVFFSLGNHLFDQKYLSTKEGLLVDCRIKNSLFTCEGIFTHTQENSFFPAITGVRKFDFPEININKGFKVSDFEITPVSLTDGRVVLEAKNNGKTSWKSHPIPMVFMDEAKLDGKKEFLVILEKHYSNMDNEIGLRPYVYSFSETALISRWRGSALAYPILDIKMMGDQKNILCALHRGDSFINPDSDDTSFRVLSYKWNGFGFSGAEENLCDGCWGKEFPVP